ncbi:MAG: 4-hydroxy-tetrahydrodipicolinate reductase, partial [Lentisphaeria bacterium]|nr:4-hydroxy-tetrahydrodipicolinate reductase [Lentisphaeria bacterium]
MSKIRVCVIGAAGRMGRRLVTAIVESSDLQLSGAVEIAGNPLLGSDAGTVAGVGAAGVLITDNLDEALKNSDAVINFSTSGVVEAAKKCVAANCSAVIGTTALPDADKDALKELAKTGRIVFAPNMSVGVNLLFHLTGIVAGLLADYDCEIIEMHHNQKKDAPSGTAERLGEIAAAARNQIYKEVVRHGREGIVGARTPSEIGMHSMRGGDVVGDHTVVFATGGERVELTHKASSRDTFVKGALRAVRFLSTAAPGKIYDMQDVLGLR